MAGTAGVSDSLSRHHKYNEFSLYGSAVRRGDGWEGGRGKWGAEGALFHTYEQKSSHYVFIEVNKQPRFTCQADIIAKSSMTLNVALLVHPSSIIHSIEDCHKFTGSQNDANGSRPVVLSLACLDSARVWFSCPAIIWVLHYNFAH